MFLVMRSMPTDGNPLHSSRDYGEARSDDDLHGADKPESPDPANDRPDATTSRPHRPDAHTQIGGSHRQETLAMPTNATWTQTYTKRPFQLLREQQRWLHEQHNTLHHSKRTGVARSGRAGKCRSPPRIPHGQANTPTDQATPDPPRQPARTARQTISDIAAMSLSPKMMRSNWSVILCEPSPRAWSAWHRALPKVSTLSP